jgi:hypothetical protein
MLEKNHCCAALFRQFSTKLVFLPAAFLRLNIFCLVLVETGLFLI